MCTKSESTIKKKRAFPAPLIAFFLLHNQVSSNRTHSIRFSSNKIEMLSLSNFAPFLKCIIAHPHEVSWGFPVGFFLSNGLTPWRAWSFSYWIKYKENTVFSIELIYIISPWRFRHAGRLKTCCLCIAFHLSFQFGAFQIMTARWLRIYFYGMPYAIFS